MTRPRTPRTAPLYHGALDGAVATGGVMLAVASFYLTAALQRPGLLQLVSGQLVLALVAIGVTLRQHLLAGAADLPRAVQRSLGLRAPRPVHLVGALMIGATAWVPNLHLARWVLHALGGSTRVAGLEQLLRAPTPALTLACLMVVPPLCEELVFRGLWARALAARTGMAAACTITALAFGSYHLSSAQWLPATLLGGVLAWASLRSGSLWTAIALHAANNAMATLTAAGLVGPLARCMDLYPSASVALAVTLSLVGVLLLRVGPFHGAEKHRS